MSDSRERARWYAHRHHREANFSPENSLRLREQIQLQTRNDTADTTPKNTL